MEAVGEITTASERSHNVNIFVKIDLLDDKSHRPRWH